MNPSSVILLYHALKSKLGSNSSMIPNSLSYDNFKNLSKKHLKSSYSDAAFDEMLEYMKKKDYLTAVRDSHFLLHFNGISPHSAKVRFFEKMESSLKYPETKSQFVELLDAACGAKLSNEFVNHVIKSMLAEKLMVKASKKHIMIVRTLSRLTVKGALIEILKYDKRQKSAPADLKKTIDATLAAGSSQELAGVVGLFADP